MNDNYIVINGKKAELTEEQLKQLGIGIESERSNPFDRVKENKLFYYIGTLNLVTEIDKHYPFDERCFEDANYFNNEDFANQVMLHQQLYRKLLKYAYDNHAQITEYQWIHNKPKHFIYYNHMSNKFDVQSKQFNQPFGGVYFNSSTVAEQAIKDVVEPFMEDHPEFIW